MSRRTQRGFSLIELMVVLVILTIVMGIVFNVVANMQKRYRTEEQRLDITQDSREFVDQIERDLRNIGYPNARMFNPAPARTNTALAAGLIAASATDIWFEGDIDGSGSISNVRYTLKADANGNCPCALQRSVVYRSTTVDPASITPNPGTELSYVVNSIGGTSAWTIAGNAPSGTSNDTLYSSYKSAPVFQFFDSSMNEVTVPTDLTSSNLSAGTSAAANIAYVVVTVNVLAPFPDAQTGLRPANSMRTSIRLTNL